MKSYAQLVAAGRAARLAKAVQPKTAKDLPLLARIEDNMKRKLSDYLDVRDELAYQRQEEGLRYGKERPVAPAPAPASVAPAETSTLSYADLY